MLKKSIITILTLAIYGIISKMISAKAMTTSGQAAVLQFNSSDSDYISSIGQMSFYSNITYYMIGVLIVALYLIWRKDLKNLFSSLFIIGLVFVSIQSNDAYAYYSKQDWAEVVNVLPNHSAFLIPATGETKDSQKQFESESFLNEKKVGAKRIQIPHVVLKNSGVIDYYVPGAILVLLDRTPYVVKWTKEQTKESPSNQEMCVESQDSVEVCFDVSIGANVTEEDAAKYLYWFGTEPSTSDDSNERNFPSVLNGKSLQNVMNTRVFSRIHSAYFVEFSKYAFKDMLAHKGEILSAVEKEIISEYKKMGITIEFVGIASQLRFNKQLQDAITNLQSAQYDKEAAAAKLEAAKTDRYIAETEILKAQAEPYKKWDGKSFPNVPNVMVSSDSVLQWFKSIVDSFKSK